MTSVAIALGSNVGDRTAHLEYAIARLRAFIDDLIVSSFHETTPVDVPVPSAPFLNAAAIGRTRLSAHGVLRMLLAIERARGRERPFPNAPRTLDLDLVLYGGGIVAEPDLVVPHPRFRERAFVLAPLAEIAGAWRDPRTGKTITELWDALRSGG